MAAGPKSSSRASRPRATQVLLAPQLLNTSVPSLPAPAPTGQTFQWMRCNAVGASCVDIPNAVGLTYVLTAADVGSTIRVRETDQPPGVTGVSLPTNIVPAAGQAPVNVVPPSVFGAVTSGTSVIAGTLTVTITGSPSVGSVLSAVVS